MRCSLVLVALLSATMFLGCDKDTASDKVAAVEEGQPEQASAPAGKAKLPQAFWGAYVGEQGEKHRLTVTPSGFSTSGSYSWESQSVQFATMDCSDTNCEWTATYENYGAKKTASGSIVKMPDDSLLMTTTGLKSSKGDAYCSGTFAKGGAAKAAIPEAKSAKKALSPDEAGMVEAKAVAPVAAAPAAAPSGPGGFSVGETVEALWSGSWYDAKILKKKPGQYFITYPGYSSSWDQWIGGDKLRKKGGKMAAAAAPSAAPAGASGFSVGSRVSCNWKSGGIYYKGKITRKSGNSIHVAYDDGDKENTVVSKCRLIGGGAASTAGMVSATVSVTVNDRKPNGKAWDAFGGQPDLSLCVSGGGGTHCYPAGDGVIEVMDPQCRDSFRCTFRGVKVPKGSFTLTVVDVDLAANDTVGVATCRKGGSCSGGSAQIKVR